MPFVNTRLSLLLWSLDILLDSTTDITETIVLRLKCIVHPLMSLLSGTVIEFMSVK